MNAFGTVLRAVLPVFAVAALGGWMRHRGWLSAEADRSLTRLTITLLLPPVLGFVLVAIGIGLAWLAAPLAGAHAAAARRTFSFLAGLQNYAYLTIPLCLALFDSRTTGVLFVHNVGAETALWTLGVAVLTGRGFAGGWRTQPVVLVEGLWPWRRSAVARLYSLRVFRAGGDEVRLARRLERDVRERGRSEDSVHTQWHSHVQPMYRRFVAPQAATAHVRLPREVPEWRLDRIAARIRRLADVS